MEYCLAADIGGTKIAIALFDQTGKIHGEIHTFPVPFNPHGIADTDGLIKIMTPIVESVKKAGISLCGFGLSVCGNIDMSSGDAVLVPNLHWRNVPFGVMVKSAYGLPVYAATDVRQAALAEHIWGIAQGIDYLAWCTVGTGFGGYLYLEGKLYDGYHGFAGPFGHITLDEVNGYLCGCGRKGCFETFVAGPAIARVGQKAIDSGLSAMMAELAGGKPVTTHMVIQAYQAGDPAAFEILDQVVRLISINLSGVVNLLDLQMIVMGGGVVYAWPDLVSLVDVKIREYLMSEEAKRDLLIVKESFSNSSLYGAAAYVFVRRGILSDG